MSRTIQQIQDQIIATKNSYTELDGLNSPSQTSVWRLWTFLTAVSISFLEQIIDLFKVDIETKLTKKVSGTRNWIRDNIKLFQYSLNDPQSITIASDYTISYPVYNANYQIVTQTAIEVLDNNLVQIKVAKSSPPEPLDSLEVLSLGSYITEIMPAGIQTYLISENSDKVYIAGSVYFNGMYSSIIQTNVETSINSYLENLPFGGRFVLTELLESLLLVPGVNDIVFTRVTARRDSTSYNPSTNTRIFLLEGSLVDVNNRFYNSLAGYLTTETTTGYTIQDSINYIAQ